MDMTTDADAETPISEDRLVGLSKGTVLIFQRKNSPYRATEKASPYWIKVKNPLYSQAEGRAELFERPT
jgi:hypothetical protein